MEKFSVGVIDNGKSAITVGEMVSTSAMKWGAEIIVTSLQMKSYWHY
jgi:hypothetical protein